MKLNFESNLDRRLNTKKNPHVPHLLITGLGEAMRSMRELLFTFQSGLRVTEAGAMQHIIMEGLNPDDEVYHPYCMDNIADRSFHLLKGPSVCVKLMTKPATMGK